MSFLPPNQQRQNTERSTQHWPDQWPGLIYTIKCLQCLPFSANISATLHLHNPAICRWQTLGSCNILVQFNTRLMSSVLWCCCLGGRKGIRTVKTEWWGTGMVICLKWGVNDLHMVQLMPMPPISSLALVKSRMVYLSAAGLPRLSWKRPSNGCSRSTSSSIQDWCLPFWESSQNKRIMVPSSKIRPEAVHIHGQAQTA